MCRATVSARLSRPPGRSRPASSRSAACLVGGAPQGVAAHDGVKAQLAFAAQGQQRRQLLQLADQDHRPLHLGQPLGLLAQPFAGLPVAGQRPGSALRRAAQDLPGQQPGAGVQVQHDVVALYAGSIEHPVAQVAQPLAGIAHRPLQPAVVGPLARPEGEDLRRALLDHGRQLRLAAAGHLVADAPLVALVARLVEDLALQRLGQVLLRHPVVAVGVGVEVALAVAKALLVAAGVLEVDRHLGLPLLLHRRQGVEEAQRRVRLGRRGQVERRLGQVEAALGQPHPVERLGAGGHHPDGVRIGQAHVLAGQDQHPPEEEARVLAGIDHLGQPVERRVGVGAAQRLDEGADGVVVIVAVLVVQHRPALDALLGHGHVDDDDPLGVGRRRLHRQLQRVEHAAGVAVGHVHQVGQGIVVHLDLEPAIAPLRVGQGAAGDGHQVLFGQRL